MCAKCSKHAFWIQQKNKKRNTYMWKTAEKCAEKHQSLSEYCKYFALLNEIHAPLRLQRWLQMDTICEKHVLIFWRTKQPFNWHMILRFRFYLNSQHKAISTEHIVLCDYFEQQQQQQKIAASSFVSAANGMSCCLNIEHWPNKWMPICESTAHCYAVWHFYRCI